MKGALFSVPLNFFHELYRNKRLPKMFVVVSNKKNPNGHIITSDIRIEKIKEYNEKLALSSAKIIQIYNLKFEFKLILGF